MTDKRCFVFMLIVAVSLFVFAQSDKDRERFDYVVGRMKLDKVTRQKLKPVFFAYRKDLKTAKDVYNNVKDKYATPIKKMTLNVAQARELNNARRNADKKVLDVKSKYEQNFLSILSPQQVCYLFMFANDSKEKRAGR